MSVRGSHRFESRRISEQYDTLAPDGSEIRLLGQVRGGSMVHCTLPPGGITRAIAHRTVEEIWFFLSGRRQVWRQLGEVEQVTDVEPGMSLTIPLGMVFQFRAAGDEPLRFVIATMPPWPGDDEAEPRAGHWQ